MKQKKKKELRDKRMIITVTTTERKNIRMLAKKLGKSVTQMIVDLSYKELEKINQQELKFNERKEK